MGYVVNATAAAAFFPGKRPGTHCIGGWVGPTTRLDECGKSQPLPGFDPRTFQSVASPYTDSAMPAPNVHMFSYKVPIILIRF